jgi:pyridinium-3,5-bisthiocarboxylic acid mononucleotide nickel chelatase
MASYRTSSLLLLECNIDDMNPEMYPYVTERLLGAGAKDVWLTPLIMKGGRPGNLLSVLCDPSKQDELSTLVFAETTTLGIRVSQVRRLELERTAEIVSTAWGSIPVKVGRDAEGQVINIAPEFSACRELAQRVGRPLKEVFLDALAAWKARR